MDELESLCESTRFQFLKVELDTCATALDLGRFELSKGNTEFAAWEAAVVEKGIRTIDRFLPQVRSEAKAELEARLRELRARFESFQMALA